jgi:hypothetical protein
MSLLNDIKFKKELLLKYSVDAFLVIVFLLSLQILLTGCYSFYDISKDDYANLENMNDIKVIYKNGDELIFEKNDTTNVKIVGDSLVAVQGNEKKVIGLSELKNIKESRSDLGGTIILTILMFTFYSVLFFVVDLF